MHASVKAIALALGAAAALSLPAQAAIVFNGSSGSLAASASFNLTGTQLTAVLTNTSAADALVPIDILTGVFFNVTGGSGLLAPLSAISGGPTYLNGVQVSPAGTAIGGEWAYAGVSQYGANAGISSSGLGLFGPGDLFPPAINLAGPADPDGLQYGITSAGDNLATGNTPLMTNELTKNSVSFLFDVGNAFSLSQIGTVTFQYGTALNEPSFPGTSSSNGGPPSSGPIPEPSSGSMALLALGLLGAGFWARRKSS